MTKYIVIIILLFVSISGFSMSEGQLMANIAYAAAKSNYQTITQTSLLTYTEALNTAMAFEQYIYSAGIQTMYVSNWKEAYQRQIKSRGQFMEYTQREYIAYLKMYISLLKTMQCNQ